MPNKRSDAKQQFQAVEDLLTRWLKERRAVLGKYTAIVVTLDSRPDHEVLEQRQKALCELLVDYVSAGHFEVFHELINEAESFGDDSCALAEKLMPAIGDTTEEAMAGFLRERQRGTQPIAHGRQLQEAVITAGFHWGTLGLDSLVGTGAGGSDAKR